MMTKRILVLLVALCPAVYAEKKAEIADQKIPGSFFADDYTDNGFGYALGGRSSVAKQKDPSLTWGTVLEIKLDDRVFSGAAVHRPDTGSVDVEADRGTTALRFRIKGHRGGEQLLIGLVDAGNNGKNRTTVKCKSREWFTISTLWQTVTMPLSTFSDRGERWYEKRKAVELAKINWKKIAGVSFTAEKEMNIGCSDTGRIATVFIDDIELVPIISDMPQPKYKSWRMNNEIVTAPDSGAAADIKTVFSWCDTAFAPFISAYTYGDNTEFRVIDRQDSGGSAVFAAYLNDNEWSGVTLYRIDSPIANLKTIRESGCLEFMVKGAVGGELFSIGLLDDESDGPDRKVQSKVHNVPYCTVTREWQRAIIPLTDFSDYGKWWHSDAHYEVNGMIDWKKISDLRFSTNQYANKNITGKGTLPVTLYFSQMRIVKDCDVFSNARYWRNYSSHASDMAIDVFERTRPDSGWTASIDPKSTMTLGGGSNELDGSKALSIDFNIAEWGSAVFPFTDTASPECDWSHHAGMQFEIFSGDAAQNGMVMVIDSGNEAWTAPFVAHTGWQQVAIPFERFKPFEWWQPDGALKNGRFDLARVKSYDFRSGVLRKPGRIMVDNVLLTNRKSSDEALSTLRINQIGYERALPHNFTIANTASGGFALFDTVGGMIFSNNAREPRYWELSNDSLRSGSFDDVAAPGHYTLVLQETGEKQDIVIADGIYKKVCDASVKAFYFQRSGIDLPAKFAGIWARSAGHKDDRCILHQSTGKSGSADVHGGWYDAGDYGKYVVPAGITVGTMLALYELFPKCISDSLNIPESGNKVSDLLDEVRFELDFLSRMQDVDGGVFFKVGTLAWDGFVMPANARADRYIIGKSTASTLNLAAVMAMAARIYPHFDRAFAKQCKKSALAAWKWAIANPSVREPSESGGTGAYGDNICADEFFWAASELYLTTKKGEFRAFCNQQMSANPIKSGASWRDVGNLGIFSFIANNAKKLTFYTQAQNSLIKEADKIIAAMNNNPHGLPCEQFIWGSNSTMLNYAIVLCYAYHITKKRTYLENADNVAGYIFGNNPTGYSFVTGFGSRTPLHPHHRIMGPDNVAAPFPGFLVGGPNSEREDENSNEAGVYYPSKEPAKSYVDLQEAYASNETAINWNAALLFVLGFLSQSVK